MVCIDWGGMERDAAVLNATVVAFVPQAALEAGKQGQSSSAETSASRSLGQSRRTKPASVLSIWDHFARVPPLAFEIYFEHPTSGRPWKLEELFRR